MTADPRPLRDDELVTSPSAQKQCSHAHGVCRCGEQCACGRPGCTIPGNISKRRHSKYADRGCKQYAYEMRHQVDTMTLTQADEAPILGRLPSTRPHTAPSEGRLKARKRREASANASRPRSSPSS